MTSFNATGPAARPGPAAPWHELAGPVQFIGFERDFWWLVIRGSALLAVTLGIYRFWLTTDMRRFLWSNTQVLDEPLEYTGTARELLVGFLIAVAILIPFYALIFMLVLDLGPIGRLAGVIGFVLVTVLGHFAVYRARRYRLTRTVYRGVRFHQTGSAWRYAGLAVMWWTFIILTLGIAYPIAQSQLERFKMRNTWLGNLQGRFEGSAIRLLLRGFPMWLVIIGPLIVALITIVTMVDLDVLGEIFEELTGDADEDKFQRIIAQNPWLTIVFGVATTALVWPLLAAPFLYPALQAIVLRWWVSGLRFGDVAATSHLRISTIYGAYLRFVGWTIVLSTITSIIVAILLLALVLLIGKNLSTEMEIAATVGAVVVYVVVALGYSAIYQVKVKLGIWRAVVHSVELSNPTALERISSVGAPASAIGEGLADALNVGGF